MTEIPDPDWTLEEDRFRFLFGPLFPDPRDSGTPDEAAVANAWDVYRSAVEERDRLGYAPDLTLGEDDDDYEWDADSMRSWAAFHELLVTTMDPNALDLVAMVEERVPACAAGAADARAQIIEAVTLLTERMGA